jgi:uncharacterized membrane protein YeaQ/YmgE (transglycosylase-associated protein family)
MDWLRHPFYSIATVVLIGVVSGLLAQALVRRQRAAGKDTGIFTAACVGLAGAFLGFHFAMLSNVATDQVLFPFIVAVIGSGVMLWSWTRVLA